jgi:beta-glucosidase
MYFIFLISLLFGSFGIQAVPKKIPYVWTKEIRWKWSSDLLNDDIFWKCLRFPKNFSWGVATSAFQIEGAQTANNTFVENNWTVDAPERYANNPGCDHWNRWKEDVQHIKNLGVNAYRLSIPMDKIMPQEGVVDEEALQHYVDLCVELKKNGIEPWICLHHFTEPLWFGAKGGFEKRENIQYFVNFCLTVFNRLHTVVKFWVSFNEPVAYAMEGWARDTFPPHKKHFPITSMASVVLLNMLQSHVQMYQAFKAIDPSVQIGIVHMFHPLDPYVYWSPIDNLNAKMGNYLVHDIVLNFFKDGIYNWFYIVTERNDDAKHALDFIGLNYYRHEMVKYNTKTVKARDTEEKVIDTQTAIYPEGLYRSIQKAATLGIPIYITENGIPDETDTQRNDYIKKHLLAIQKALIHGYDVRGYHYWTLMDSLGWHGEYKKKYGLYEIRGSHKERVLREGAKPFVNFLHAQRNEKELGYA